MTKSGGARYWETLSSPEIEALDHERTIAILPVGAIEQHGPHLPLGVDAMIVQGILDRAMATLPSPLQALALPTLPVGKSDEHIAFGGTLTLAAETLIRVWTEIGCSVARAGVKKLVLFNGHGGQVAIMDVVARELRIRERMLVMAHSWFAGGLPEGLFSDDEIRYGIHAGEIETSMMLHLRPDLVAMDKAENFRPLPAEMARDGYRRLSPVGQGRMGWKAEDLHPSGACGDAASADAERGRLLVDHAAKALVELLIEVDRFPLARLADRDRTKENGG
ncbi:MAG: creatininase family protein [Alphaproteobacteria bacterium]|nr:creatininase family protein [Alphaproteobacteria bacterium]